MDKEMTLGERIIKEAEDRGLPLSVFSKEYLMLDYNTLLDITKRDDYSSHIANKIAELMGDDYKQYVIKTACAYCGTEFIGPRGKRFCCYECCYTFGNHKRAGKRLPSLQKIKFEKENIPDHSDIEAEARKAGVSYGQYVALKRMEGSGKSSA